MGLLVTLHIRVRSIDRYAKEVLRICVNTKRDKKLRRNLTKKIYQNLTKKKRKKKITRRSRDAEKTFEFLRDFFFLPDRRQEIVVSPASYFRRARGTRVSRGVKRANSLTGNTHVRETVQGKYVKSSSRQVEHILSADHAYQQTPPAAERHLVPVALVVRVLHAYAL